MHHKQKHLPTWLGLFENLNLKLYRVMIAPPAPKSDTTHPTSNSGQGQAKEDLA